MSGTFFTDTIGPIGNPGGNNATQWMSMKLWRYLPNANSFGNTFNDANM